MGNTGTLFHGYYRKNRMKVGESLYFALHDSLRDTGPSFADVSLQPFILVSAEGARKTTKRDW